MASVVELSVPVFRCGEDRDIFLSRLRALPGYDDLVARDGRWHLLLHTELDADATAELQQICRIWNINPTFRGQTPF